MANLDSRTRNLISGRADLVQYPQEIARSTSWNPANLDSSDFRQNRDEMRRVIQTEVDVSLEKDGYILAGKVDLLLGGDGKLELLDFKTSPRPAEDPELLAAYERQLCTYAHILERRHGRHVDRLLLYWTAEPRKKDALMVLQYDPRRVDEAGRHFDETVRRIQAREFTVTAPPEAAICKECDLRSLCQADGVIPLIEADRVMVRP